MMYRILFATAMMLLLGLAARAATATRLADAAPALAHLANAIEIRPDERRGKIRRHWAVPLTIAPLLQPYPYGNPPSRERRCRYVWDPRIYRHVLSCW